MKANRFLLPAAFACLAIACLTEICSAGNFGLFDLNSDIGATPQKGSGELDGLGRKYRVTGGGADIWGTADAFHFVWKKVSGDMTLTADVEFVGAKETTAALGHSRSAFVRHVPIAWESAAESHISSIKADGGGDVRCDGSSVGRGGHGASLSADARDCGHGRLRLAGRRS
jgi:hypothetical protein